MMIFILGLCVCVCVSVKEVSAAAFLMGCVLCSKEGGGDLGNNSVTKGKSKRKTKTPPCPSMEQTC